MNTNYYSRRSFLKTTAAASAGLAFSAKSYGSILGANNQIRIAIIGVNGRGKALTKSSLNVSDVSISHICDVDSQAVEQVQMMVKEATSESPKGEGDFRKILDDPEVDAIAIAAPDHWHAPMAIMALKAGKHVYVEKPCGHNPHEGEMLVEAQKKYGKVVQMGNQQRSSPTSIEAVKRINEGIIGRAYYGKAWYANNRGSIGTGKSAPIPEWLDYELWQGPAVRMPYQDNLVHYNWHWFKNYGTGEICNNGTHEIDICRWALGVDNPIRVTSSGGRYQFEDDWEFYDTQVATFDYEDNKTIVWEGMSCNATKFHNRGRGALIRGTEGSILLDRNGYLLYDKGGKVVEEVKEKERSATTDTIGAGALDVYHMDNFMAAIRDGQTQNSPIDEGHKSVLICHLGNIAQYTNSVLEIDPTDGKILNNKEAMKYWSREYAPGWEMSV